MKIFFVDEDFEPWFDADLPAVPRIGESVEMESIERRVSDVAYSFPESGECKIYCVCPLPAGVDNPPKPRPPAAPDHGDGAGWP